MPLNARQTTASYDACRLDKPNAAGFTVQVANQTVYYQVNAAPQGRGENWVPMEGAMLQPGFWTFDGSDFTDYGVTVVQGIRFKAVDVADPAIITAS